MTPVIEDLRCAVMGIQAGGGTALWKALLKCEEHLTSYAAQYPTARKRILVLSDGQDTTVRLSELFSILGRSQYRSSRATLSNPYYRPPTPYHGGYNSEEDDLYGPSTVTSTQNYSQYWDSLYDPSPSTSSSTHASTYPDPLSPVFRPFGLSNHSTQNPSFSQLPHFLGP